MEDGVMPQPCLSDEAFANPARYRGVPCSKCGAAAGEKCSSRRGGQVNHVHVCRVADTHEIQRREHPEWKMA